MLFSDLNGDGSIDADTEVLQENHYYAFGLGMEGEWQKTNTAGDQNRYRYNGKELNEELGLYDYGARWYDPAIARWTSIDPLADSYASLSPYNYVANNPILLIDPNGMEIVNSAEKERKKYEEQYNTLKTTVDNAEKRYGTKKSDFKSKKSFKNYKRAKRARNQAKRNLRTWTKNAEATESLINEFESQSPNMFAELDNLKNEYGEEVDVNISVVANVEGDNDGANLHGFEENGEEVRPVSRYGTNTIEVQVARTPSGDRSQLNVMRHEAGHTSYQAQNTKSYYNYLRANKLLRRGYDGHRRGDPSGARALQYGSIKDLKR
jgi:RHS repeat-associated protein